jgi:hypothetical protein
VEEATVVRRIVGTLALWVPLVYAAAVVAPTWAVLVGGTAAALFGLN